MDDEAEGGVKGDIFSGDESKTGGEARKVLCVEAGPGGGTNLCTHFHRPVLPRHCGSSPACIAGSVGP